MASTTSGVSSLLRSQGGPPDLHPNTGQLSLSNAGLWDGSIKHSRTKSDCMKRIHVGGNVEWDENTKDKKDICEEGQFAGVSQLQPSHHIRVFRALSPGSTALILNPGFFPALVQAMFAFSEGVANMTTEHGNGAKHGKGKQRGDA